MSYYQLTFRPAVARQPRAVTMYRINPEDGASPRRAVEIVREGGLVVFPSDEGYMVGCNAHDRRAVARLCEVTGASPDALLHVTAPSGPTAAVDGKGQSPRHPVPLALIRDAGIPLVATPPRPGGRPTPTAQQAIFILGDAVDLVLDAGPNYGAAGR